MWRCKEKPPQTFAETMCNVMAKGDEGGAILSACPTDPWPSIRKHKKKKHAIACFFFFIGLRKPPAKRVVP